MKKTNRNQNMTDQQLSRGGGVKNSSIQPGPSQNSPERYSDSNLNKTGIKNKKQRYDDRTGTVENGIG